MSQVTLAFSLGTLWGSVVACVVWLTPNLRRFLLTLPVLVVFGSLFGWLTTLWLS